SSPRHLAPSVAPEAASLSRHSVVACFESSAIPATVEVAVERRTKIGAAEIQLPCSFLLTPNESRFDSMFFFALGTARADLPTVIGCIHRAFLSCWRWHDSLQTAA